MTTNTTYKALSPKAANTLVNRAVNNTAQLMVTLQSALQACVFHAQAHCNGQLGKDLHNRITPRLKDGIRQYLLQTKLFVYDKDNDVINLAKGLENDRTKAFELVAKLPNFADFNRTVKKEATEEKPVEFIKTLERTLSRGKRDLKGKNLDDSTNAASQKALAAFESYKDNIANGVTLAEAGIAAQKTSDAIAKDAIAAFTKELLDGKTKEAKRIRALLAKQQERIERKTSKVTTNVTPIITTNTTSDQLDLVS